MKSKILFAIGFLFLVFQNVSANEPLFPETDRIRLAEVFKIKEKLGNRLWKNHDKTPFAVLLVTPETEFLVRHPKPSKDFTLIGYDKLLQSNVYHRKRQFNPGFLATFPFEGTPTIIIGQAENTEAKTSTPWVAIAFHEHFHQLQYTEPDYYKSVNALNLSGGDQTGMWMLNFPFPYEAENVKKQVRTLCDLLVEALETKDNSALKTKLDSYLKEREKLVGMLKPDEYRYFSFQLWQEGIARYTQYRMAKLIAENYKPGKAFTSLKDYKSFKAAADEILVSTMQELKTLKLDGYKRVTFYPFGAGEGLLLDRVKPNWRENYFTEKFYLEKYFSAAR